jgi:hypothetical protein
MQCANFHYQPEWDNHRTCFQMKLSGPWQFLHFLLSQRESSPHPRPTVNLASDWLAVKSLCYWPTSQAGKSEDYGVAASKYGRIKSALLT